MNVDGTFGSVLIGTIDVTLGLVTRNRSVISKSNHNDQSIMTRMTLKCKIIRTMVLRQSRPVLRVMRDELCRRDSCKPHEELKLKRVMFDWHRVQQASTRNTRFHKPMTHIWKRSLSIPIAGYETAALPSPCSTNSSGLCRYLWNLYAR